MGGDLGMSSARPFHRKARSLRRRISAALDRIGQRMGRGGWSPNGRKPSPLIGGKIEKLGRRDAVNQRFDRKRMLSGRHGLSKKSLTIRES